MMDEQEPKGVLNVSPERLEEIKKKLEAGEQIDLSPEEVTNIEQQTGEEIVDPYGDIADLPIAYDDASVEALDPAVLAAAYAQAAKQKAAVIRAEHRGSQFTKKTFDKGKARKRNKAAKNSRKKNRKK